MIAKSYSSDALIVGAGITGVASALALAEKGVTVTVIERYRPAAMASGWTLAGVRQSGRDPAELALAKQAVSIWHTLDERLDSPTGYRQTGNLRLARNTAEARIIRQLVNDQRETGLDIELLEAAELQSQFPVLSDTLSCAAYCRTDGQADPLATSAAYRLAAERSGVRFLTGTAAHQVNIRAGRFHSLNTSAGILHAGLCILATGVQTNDLLEPLALPLPIKKALVTVLQSEPTSMLLGPVLGVANADLAFRQQADGCLRMTSGAEITDHEPEEVDGLPRISTTTETIKTTQSKISRVLPAAVEVPIARVWGGLLDMTPDNLPVIDNLPGIDGIIVAAGFSGHGFGIGPAVGETIAELALQKTTRLPISDFAYDRFIGNVQGNKQQTNPALHG
ncbi:MAG: NAD(P)/FAD-dependent oxidoreductase [Granulosicoccus sp.]